MSGFASMPAQGSGIKKAIGGMQSAMRTVKAMQDTSAQNQQPTSEGYSSSSGVRSSFRSRRRTNLLGSGSAPEEMQ